jgi:hypothetical protein
VLSRAKPAWSRPAIGDPELLQPLIHISGRESKS